MIEKSFLYLPFEKKERRKGSFSSVGLRPLGQYDSMPDGPRFAVSVGLSCFFLQLLVTLVHTRFD